MQDFWSSITNNTKTRLELHYARMFAQLLGRISKKLPDLEALPNMERAPKKTRDYIAEATRCCLLKLDLACIALCRACLEHGLSDILTDSMKDELKDKIENNRRFRQAPNALKALIEVCGNNGKLIGCQDDAEQVRNAGNDILHLHDSSKWDAWKILSSTRKIIGVIYSKGTCKDG